FGFGLGLGLRRLSYGRKVTLRHNAPVKPILAWAKASAAQSAWSGVLHGSGKWMPSSEHVGGGVGHAIGPVPGSQPYGARDGFGGWSNRQTSSDQDAPSAAASTAVCNWRCVTKNT